MVMMTKARRGRLSASSLCWIGISVFSANIHSVSAFLTVDHPFVTQKYGKIQERSYATSLWDSTDSNGETDGADTDPTSNNKSTPDVPLTPCNRICRYNANVFDGQVCIGCFRETFEIAAWQGMSPSEKCFALMDAMDRLEEVNTGNVDVVADGAVTREELQRQAEYWNQQTKAS